MKGLQTRAADCHLLGAACCPESNAPSSSSISIVSSSAGGGGLARNLAAGHTHISKNRKSKAKSLEKGPCCKQKAVKPTRGTLYYMPQPFQKTSVNAAPGNAKPWPHSSHTSMHWRTRFFQERTPIEAHSVSCCLSGGQATTDGVLRSHELRSES